MQRLALGSVLVYLASTNAVCSSSNSGERLPMSLKRVVAYCVMKLISALACRPYETGVSRSNASSMYSR